jgi:hypothetical protein
LSLKERLAKLSLTIAADDQPMVAAAAKPAAKKAPAKPKAKPADDGDFDMLDIDDAPKKPAAKPKAAKEGAAVGGAVKAVPKKAPAKPKAKEESPVAARDKPARARKPVTYKVGDSDEDDFEDDDESFHADDSDDFE